MKKQGFVVLLVGFLISLTLNGWAQKEEYVKENYLRYKDFVYKDYIKTATLFPKDYPIGFPIMGLGKREILSLSFDDMEGGVKDYSYTVVHCNADWQPSDLNDMEYIDGFNSDEIVNYEFSFNTLIDYTNYQLELPNENMKFTKSGNYLLKVYLSDSEELVLTKRFLIQEGGVSIDAVVQRATAVSKSRSHQEIDFVINHPGSNIRNPRSEVQVTVMQNGRWDNSISDLEPLFIKEKKLIYDYQNEIVFSGGKEFREVDLRTTRYQAENIQNIESDLDRYYMKVIPDKERDGRIYDYDAEANGQFIIENFHEDDPHIECDYIRTTFTLQQLFPERTGNFYLFGALSDWQLKEEFKMRYDEKLSAYQCTVDLKQGYYNYSYAFVEDGSEIANLERIEGGWFETENNYQILVYYRPFGDRYDRLVGYELFNSVK